MRRGIVAAVVLSLVMSACASPTVAEQGGASPSMDTTPLVPQQIGNILDDARRRVRAGLNVTWGFTPLAYGPSAQHRGGTIAYVAADLTNNGVNTVSRAVTQAATAIGWDVLILDGKGNAQGRTEALLQAIAMHPLGIVLGGFDATEQSVTIRQAAQLDIPVVGWHAGSAPGPIRAAGVFTNVTTDPREVAWLAAAYAVASSDGRAGVTILTDSQYQVAEVKARAMRDYLRLCAGCEVLAVEDSPIAQVDARMPALVASLLQRFGGRLDYLLGVNGNYFGATKPALRDAGEPGVGPPYQVAAGDGDDAGLQRIRATDYQAATVAEPMVLQGWQLVDELNRALAGEPPSGFVPRPALITAQNVPAGAVFDPPSGYQARYLREWNSPR
jgi:ribose transport system substrate-binding protein